MPVAYASTVSFMRYPCHHIRYVTTAVDPVLLNCRRVDRSDLEEHRVYICIVLDVRFLQQRVLTWLLPRKLLFYPEDGDTAFSRNACKCSPDYRASHPSRPHLYVSICKHLSPTRTVTFMRCLVTPADPISRLATLTKLYCERQNTSWSK